MSEIEKFWADYFIQTRREIDTEKQERDKILNYAFLVMGAIAFAVAQNEKAQIFLREVEGLAVGIPALAVLSSLFWIRKKKLQQIADRWFVLRHLLQSHVDAQRLPFTLEAVVTRGLPGWRYVSKDVILNLTMSLPLYMLLVLQIQDAIADQCCWRVIASVLAIGGHAGISSLILGRRLRDPLVGQPAVARGNQ